VRRVYKELLKIGITVLLFYLLFRMVPIRKIQMYFRSSDYRYILCAFLLFYLYYFAFAFRWWYLLRHASVEQSISLSYQHILISFFMNNFLPSAVGQDAVRSAYAGGKDRFSHCLGVALIDRLTGFIGMLVLGIFALLSSVQRIKILSLVYTILVLILILLYVLLTLKGRFVWLKKKLLGIRFLNIGNEVKALYDGFSGYREKSGVLINAVLISAVVQGFITLINWVIAKGMGVNVSFFSLLVLLPIITVVSLIPITVSGLGLREFSYYYLFGLIGIKGEVAASLSLMFYFISVLASIPGGILFLFTKRKS